MAMTPERATQFKQEVNNKVEALLDEFAGGSISRAHFDVVYRRYSRQLTIAEQAIESGQLEDIDEVINDVPTVMLHAAARGIAVGMSIIHHTSMDTVRQFGDFHIAESQLTVIMDNLRDNQSSGVRNFSDVQHLTDNVWVAVCSLEHTSLLTIFRNEPAVKQVQELERRHRDFESANRNILNQSNPDPDHLVYPVELFVESS